MCTGQFVWPVGTSGMVWTFSRCRSRQCITSTFLIGPVNGGSFPRDAAMQRDSTCAVQPSNKYKCSPLPHLGMILISYCLQKRSGLHCLYNNDPSVIWAPGELVIDRAPFVLKPFNPCSRRLL